ncbi:MAG TPA: prepilin-type N-terminal cleavage/methylation domain-containing protein [Actinomycetota bacterium]|nr:prepilin-type N-terminal cleavage/methylation domain-containing protein [Actinomycetota bacterium]
MDRREEGFTLVEVMWVILLLAVVSTSFYQVLVTQSRGADLTRRLTRLTDEARLGFNRMVRDTREGDYLSAASATSFTVKVNYDGDAFYENPNEAGDYEVLTYAYDASARTITLNGSVLMRDVYPVDHPSTPAADVFTYYSNNLEYDWDGDGKTTWQDLDQSPAYGLSGIGDQSNTLSAAEIPHLTTVAFAVSVGTGDAVTPFYARAQMRNRV